VIFNCTIYEPDVTNEESIVPQGLYFIYIWVYQWIVTLLYQSYV